LIFATGGGPDFVAVGDFNSDHIQDLAVTGAVLLGNGNGTFRMPSFIGVIDGNGVSGQSIAPGDFNGDGIHDLAVTGGLVVFLGNGDGTFQPAANFPATDGASMVVGDFNSDTRQDIAVVGYVEAFFRRFNTLSVLINNTP